MPALLGKGSGSIPSSDPWPKEFGGEGREPPTLFCPLPGFFIYFGYGIWHSAENHQPRELQEDSAGDAVPMCLGRAGRDGLVPSTWLHPPCAQGAAVLEQPQPSRQAPAKGALFREDKAVKLFCWFCYFSATPPDPKNTDTGFSRLLLLINLSLLQPVARWPSAQLTHTHKHTHRHPHPDYTAPRRGQTDDNLWSGDCSTTLMCAQGKVLCASSPYLCPSMCGGPTALLESPGLEQGDVTCWHPVEGCSAPRCASLPSTGREDEAGGAG